MQVGCIGRREDFKSIFVLRLDTVALTVYLDVKYVVCKNYFQIKSDLQQRTTCHAYRQGLQMEGQTDRNMARTMVRKMVRMVAMKAVREMVTML